MKLKHILLLILNFIICACNSSEDTVDLFNYTDIEPIDIELALEIGESEDYIPGNLSDLIVFPDGTMLVSDRSNGVIIQFSPEGENNGVMSREGGGPGEIPRFYSMVGVGNDSLLVIHSGGARVDFFGKDIEGIFKYSRGITPEFPEGDLERFGARSTNEIYAISDDILSRFNNFEEYRQGPVLILDVNNRILRDSLHMVKISNVSITGEISPDGVVQSMNVGRRLPYRYEDRFHLLNGEGYMIARSDSSAFYFYDRYHNLQNKVALNTNPRPVTDNDLEYHLENFPQRGRRDAEDYIREVKPPFLNVWVSDERILLHTDSSEEGMEMVVVDIEGEPLGKFLLPHTDVLQHVTDDQIYTIHRNPELGHSVRVYDLNL